MCDHLHVCYRDGEVIAHYVHDEFAVSRVGRAYLQMNKSVCATGLLKGERM